MTKQQETVEVRGIAAAIQAMSFPTFQNLGELLGVFGFKLVKVEKH